MESSNLSPEVAPQAWKLKTELSKSTGDRLGVRRPLEMRVTDLAKFESAEGLWLTSTRRVGESRTRSPVGAELQKVKSWGEFLEIIGELRAAHAASLSPLLFRGQEDCEWSLRTTLRRGNHLRATSARGNADARPRQKENGR
jgi:hypothetical protein